MLGGTETFHYNLAEALTAAGHEVIFFSMYDERNIPCAQDKYFVSNVDYNDPNLSTFTGMLYFFKTSTTENVIWRCNNPIWAMSGFSSRISFSMLCLDSKEYINLIPILIFLNVLKLGSL